MKIHKGYALSQFIELIRNNIDLKAFKRLNLIYKYHDFIKKPVTIGMIKNPIPKPNNYNANQNPMCVDDSKEWKVYLEAEKKVIFKGWNKISTLKEEKKSNYIFKNGTYEIEFTQIGMIWITVLKSSFCSSIITLSDIFRYTDGKLKLKNVEI